MFWEDFRKILFNENKPGHFLKSNFIYRAKMQKKREGLMIMIAAIPVRWNYRMSISLSVLSFTEFYYF